jgi:hypothetical protein
VFDFRFNFSHRNSVWTVFNFSQVGSDLIDVVAGVPGADALSVSALLRRDKPRVLADRQVSPTVLSSSLFRHAPRIIVFNRLASSRRCPARRMMRCISNKPRIS